MFSSDSTNRGGLARRQFRLTSALVLGLLLTSGVLEALLGYRQARQQVASVQLLQAQAAAAEVTQYLRSIERSLLAVQRLPWGMADFGPQRRREELHRLLALAPALVQLVDVEPGGREQMVVSRTDPDQIFPGTRRAVTAPQGYGNPRFDAMGEPVVDLTVPRAGEPAMLTVATMNLRFLADVVSGLRLADAGVVYVVDASGLLIAHADATQTLRQQHVAEHPAVLAARAVATTTAPHLAAMEGPGLGGINAMTTAIREPETGWHVFVEQPVDVVMQPVWAAVWRTTALLVLAAALAIAASASLARRLTQPIARLRAATNEMVAGRLDQHLELSTGDELQGLAEDFNAMASRLSRSHAELEHKVELRTAELAQRRDEAERANAAKTRFLATASHDLRQPMHAIGLLVGLLRERIGPGEGAGLAAKTYDAVQSMEGMFAGLLDISRLDAGAVAVRPQIFALQALLDNLQRAYGPLATERGLRLSLRRSPLRLHTDPALLERVLGNLVGNALAYTRRGGVVVACRRRGAGAVLQVVDSGVGIAPEWQARVFDEFERIEPGTGQGLGLGLSIVSRTAGLLGMPVRLRSRPGHGSVFELQLDAALAAVTQQLPSAAWLPAPRSNLSGAFVLVVDDDDRNRDASLALLAHWGCLVVGARSVDSALLELQAHLRAPDIVLTDLRLGRGADGLDLVRSVRQHCGSCIPALLVTAELQLPTPTEERVTVLHKPVGTERLMQSLAALYDASAPRGLSS